VTSEKLTANLATLWPSGGVVSSEAGIVFGAHSMNSEKILLNLATLNVLWDGGALHSDRKSVESHFVRRARLTVALQVQEATLLAFFDKSNGLARGSGFLARFVLAWPESTQGFRPFSEPSPSWPR
jgi:putative DNA primase/helicase